MTLELLSFQRHAGYAGVLNARHPILAGRFHFWRGASGRRYAVTRYALGEVPAYENAVALFVRRRGDEVFVLGVATGARLPSPPIGTEEVHIHLAQGGAEGIEQAAEDLAKLVVRRPSLYVVDRQAA